MLLALHLGGMGLVLPSVAPSPPAFVQAARPAATTPVESAIFPGDDEYAWIRSSMLLAKREVVQPVLTEEEAEQAKADARVKGAAIVLLSALPSFYAQNELVWKKEARGEQVYGKKGKTEDKKKKRR